jgi:hypothetical protein
VGNNVRVMVGRPVGDTAGDSAGEEASIEVGFGPG